MRKILLLILLVNSFNLFSQYDDKWKEVYGTEDKEPETITLIDQKKTLTKEEKILELHNRAKTLESEAKKLYNEADKLNGIK